MLNEGKSGLKPLNKRNKMANYSLFSAGFFLKNLRQNCKMRIFGVEFAI